MDQTYISLWVCFNQNSFLIDIIFYYLLTLSFDTFYRKKYKIFIRKVRFLNLNSMIYFYSKWINFLLEKQILQTQECDLFLSQKIDVLLEKKFLNPSANLRIYFFSGSFFFCKNNLFPTRKADYLIPRIWSIFTAKKQCFTRKENSNLKSYFF